jgi:hypothetical protein
MAAVPRAECASRGDAGWIGPGSIQTARTQVARRPQELLVDKLERKPRLVERKVVAVLDQIEIRQGAVVAARRRKMPLRLYRSARARSAGRPRSASPCAGQGQARLADGGEASWISAQAPWAWHNLAQGRREMA